MKSQIKFTVGQDETTADHIECDGVELSEVYVDGEQIYRQPFTFEYIDSLGGYYGVTGLKDGYENPTDIIIPPTYKGLPVTRIKANAFSSSKGSKVETAYIPSSVEYIDGFAFYASGLRSLNRGTNLIYASEIGDYAFYGCNLPFVILDSSYLTIGAKALSSSGAAYIFYGAEKRYWDQRVTNNDESINDKVYFYSYSEPSEPGRYWHRNPLTGLPSLWFSECDINGHKPNLLETQEPTCSEAGWNHYVCIACGEEYTEEIPATGDHKWSDWKVELEPSCIEGLQRRVCATCGGVEEKAIPANGSHVWASDLCTEPKICASCGYVDPYHTVQSGHYMELLHNHEPYCDVGGLQVYKCRHCSYQKRVDIPALDHDWGDWYPTIYPTGITEGTKRRECKRCSKIETAPIPKIETADEYFDYTLLEDGTYSVKPLPDISLPAELVIPSEYEGIPVTQIEKEAFEGCNEYSPGRKIISVYIPSSIKHIGAYAFQECYGIEEVIIPSSVEYVGRQAFYDCGATIYCEAASQHEGWHSEWSDSDDPNTVEWDYHNDPENWEDDGLYAGSYLITVDEAATNVTVSSSCGSIAAGAVNGWTHAAAIKIPLNVQNIQPKAFTDCKNLTIYCEAESKPEGWLDGWCDSSVTIVWGFTGCVEHSWSDWEITIDSTCVENGERKRTCAKCGEVEVEIINASHDWDSEVEVVPPTCTDGGYTIHRCNNCAETYWDNFTDALGHDWGEWATTQHPTCESEGVFERACKRCGEKESQPITALGHIWLAPTCTTPKTCGRCGATEGEPLGHTPSDWIIDTEATTETEGSKHKECTRCGVVLETAVIPKLEETDKYILTESGEFLTDEEGNKLIIEGE